MTRKEILVKARGIAQKARDEKRELTAGEAAEFDGLMKDAEQALAVERSEALFQRLAAIDDDGTPADGSKGAVLSFKGLSGRIRKAHENTLQVKSLLSTGSTVTTSEEVASPVSLGMPATSVLDFLPVRKIEGGVYSYLRAVTRTNNAAPVADGAPKPVSQYQLERVDGKLSVVAHLSEPIPEYWIKDSADLSRFLDTEMAFGIAQAVEEQAVNGNGTPPNFTGMLAVSGIQSQAFATDAVTSIRKAITGVEVLGYKPSGLVMNPTDFEALELLNVDAAHYALSTGAAVLPVDRAKMQVWGVPVALSNTISEGTALLISEGAAGLVTDGVVDTRVGYVAGGFEKNEVVARVETRAAVEVYRPDGLVEIALAA